jgi:hypothetical protein
METLTVAVAFLLGLVCGGGISLALLAWAADPPAEQEYDPPIPERR